MTIRDAPVRACVVALLALCPALATLAQTLPEQVTLPAPTGPYAVGREAFDWTDQNRDDPLAPEPGIKRSLTGYIWYPAVRGAEARAPYVPAAILEALQRQANPAVASRARAVSVDQSRVIGHSLDRPALAAQPRRFPVLLLKPGRGGLVLQYAALAEELASHGYVVAGSDSPYTTPVIVHEDGRIVQRSPRGAPPESQPGLTSELAPGQANDLLVPVVEAWAADNRFVLDRLAQLDADRTGRFAGRLDLRAVGAFGHSLGGGAAMQFCRDDRRCRASINIDGALWGDVAVKGLPKPALFLFSDRPMLDRANPDNAANPLIQAIERLRAGFPNKPNLVILRGSQHYNFSDTALFTEPGFARSAGMLGSIDPLRGIALTREQVRGFFDVQLKGKPAPRAGSGNGELFIE